MTNGDGEEHRKYCLCVAAVWSAELARAEWFVSVLSGPPIVRKGASLCCIADGEDGLQIWTAAANILNKQSIRGVLQLGPGKGAKTSHLKRSTRYDRLHQICNIVYLERPEKWKMDMSCENWNLKNVYSGRTTSLKTVTRKLAKSNSDLPEV
jgi:hypothetical protein